MAIEITKVLDVGPGWNRVLGSDGQVYTLKGDYNWRSNNPGNLEYGPFAISMGAIGQGAVPQGRERGFAIFPSYEAGENARIKLQFESPRYKDLTIAQAISRFAPPNENDTQAYIRAVTQAAGVPASTKMSDLTAEQRSAFLSAQRRVEGFKQGDIYAADGVRLPPGEIPEVASQIDMDAARSAPLYTFDASGRPVNATTGQVVEQSDPAFGALMAYQQASTNTRPQVTAPTPASVEDRVTARNKALPPTARLPTIGPTGNGPAPSAVPKPPSVTNRQAQNDALQDRLGQADQEAMSDLGSMPSANALGAMRSNSALKVPAMDAIGTMPTQQAFETVMKPTKVENPEYLDALNEPANIPLGEMVYSGSRDSVAQVAAGRRAAQNMPPQWITKMVPTRVPVQSAPQSVQSGPKPLEITVSGANIIQPAALAGTNGYRYAPNALGGFTNVGRINPALSPAATYAQRSSARNNPTNAAERMQQNSRSGDSNTPDSIAS